MHRCDRKELARVIVTDAYKRAVDPMDEHNFVLLVGETAVRNSTIASNLEMAALARMVRVSTLKIDEPEKFVEQVEY